jgi:formate dehydrogenase subunit delta
MDNNNLIKMANNIGAFFQSEPDREQAITGILQHIRNFWEPRMRSQIISHVEHGGEDLIDIVAEAIKRLAKP